MSSMPPNMPQQNPAAPAKKTGPLVWILGGVAVLCIVGMATCGVVGYLALRVVKNAGFDPDLMKRNPGLAMAKMATALNSNLDLVSSNERTGTITMRDKTTGKVVSYRFDSDKKSLQIVGDDGQQVTLGGNAKDGAVTVQSAEGTVRFGGAAGASAAPSWVPVYPGSNPQATMSAQTKDGNQNTFTFKTNDAAAKVISYYQDQLKSGGFTVNLVTTGDQGGMVQAEDAGKKRTIIVTASSSAQGTEGSVTAVEKP